MSGEVAVDVDAILHGLGRLGRWQVTQYVQLLHIEVIVSAMVVGIVFIGYEPPYSCNVHTPGNETGNTTYKADGQCSLYDVRTNESVSCIYGYNYSIPKDRTIVTEWDLTCDKEYLTGLGQTFFVLGQAVGAYLFSFLADCFGRRKVFILSLWALVGTGILIGVMPNISSFLALRFLAGMFQQGVCIAPYVLGVELFPAEMRVLIGVGFGLCWGLGLTLFAGLACLMQYYPWRYLEMAIAATGGYILINTFTCVESPRWLLATGRREEAMKIFRIAARVNKVNIDKLLDNERELSTFSEKQPLHKEATILQKEDNECNEQSPVPNRQKYGKNNFVDIISHPMTRKVFLIMLYIWSVDSLTYYGLILMSNRMAGSRYLNFFWNSVVEMPSHLVALAGSHWLGRRKTAIALHSLVAVFLLAAITIQNYSDSDPGMGQAVGVLSILGKFCISASFMLIWIFTPELYPTNLRSLGLGCASFAARIGGMIAPFAGLLAKKVQWAPGLIFGLSCLGAVGLIWLLPETSGRQLPQTLQELDVWNEEDKEQKYQKKTLQKKT